MSITDILIIIGIIAFVILGVRDGFLKKIFGIIGLIGGLICATKFMTPLADILINWIGLSNETALIIAFFVIFVVVVFFINLLYRWFGKSGQDAIKAISRIAGGFLGAIQGILVVSLILVMFNFFNIPSEEEKKESILYDHVITIAPKVFDATTRWLPDSKKFFDEIKDKIENFRIP